VLVLFSGLCKSVEETADQYKCGQDFLGFGCNFYGDAGVLGLSWCWIHFDLFVSHTEINFCLHWGCNFFILVR